MKIFSILTFTCLLFFTGCSSKPKIDSNGNYIKNDSIQSGKVIPADTYYTGTDSLYITLVGHGSLMFEYKGKIIHVDPYSDVADYSKLPKANLVLITHEHSDHFDINALDAIKAADTRFIMSKVCNDSLKYGEAVNNGDSTSFAGISIAVIPAYNIINKSPDGEFYHPYGRGNGYVLSFDNLRIYVAGDTENIPEMDVLKGTVDIAFIPKNLPYTMSDDMFIDAAKKVTPKVLYPYHMAEFDADKIGKALENTGIKIKVRPMVNK